jgi:hypothetical protein
MEHIYSRISNMNRLSMVSLMYVGWIIVHFMAANLYVKLCTPLTFIGFIMSPFAASSAQCVGLRWIIHTGGNNIMMMWCLIGLWGAKFAKIV